MKPEAAHPIVFFDGVCGLCNGFVDFVLARDRQSIFRFATLQGKTAAERLPRDTSPPPGAGAGKGEAPHAAAGNGKAPGDAAGLRSMVLLEGSAVYRKSEAVLRILAKLGGVWVLARPLRLVPLFARDTVYDFIAGNRYRWFGKRETCRMPAPGERARFLP